MGSQEKFLGVREIEHDNFENYRQVYPGRRKKNHTWKYKVETYAKLFGWRPAFIQGDRTLTWNEFNRRCNRLARGLEELGVRKGERIAILGFNSIEWMEIYFAASKVGAVPVNVNPRFVEQEIKYILEDSDAVVAFVEQPYVDVASKIKGDLPLLKHIVIYDVGREITDLPTGTVSYDDLFSYDDSNPRVDVFNDDFCYLMYTGGTTGFPKGTVWDGEQRVRGLDMMLVNNIIPIVDRLAELPDEAVHGISVLFSSNERIVAALDRMLTSRTFRRIIKSETCKAAFLNFFKFTAGNPYALKVLGALQREGIRFLCSAPLFHGAGYEGAFTYLGSIAATIVFLPTPHPFVPREFWETIERHRVHTCVIVGDAFALPLVEELRRAEKEGKGYDLSSLWAIVSSGVRWSPHIKKELLERIPGVLLVDSMGTSESSGAFAAITSSVDKKIRPAGANISRKGLYRRQVFPCRVYNPETNRDVVPGSGEIGEFLYGGYMALGYWKCPRKTANDFRVIDGERWFFAGDEGTVDEEGNFNLIGRGGSYLINTGGEKVYSEEVEEIIKSHPKVYDVAVVGIPDPRWGQAVTALVELREGESASEEDIIEYCRTRMAGYKRPRHIFFVERVPRSSSGKIDRSLALQVLAERFNLQTDLDQ